MSERKEPRRTRKARASRIGIGVVRSLSKDGLAGMISPLDGSEELYFDLSDDRYVDPEEIELQEKQIVQYIKEISERGPRAKGLVVLDEEEEEE